MLMLAGSGKLGHSGCAVDKKRVQAPVESAPKIIPNRIKASLERILIDFLLAFTRCDFSLGRNSGLGRVMFADGLPALTSFFSTARCMAHPP